MARRVSLFAASPGLVRRHHRASQSRRRLSARHLARPLHVETLEARRVLATFMVTNLSDGPVVAAGDLPGSLRQAIFDANAAATVDNIEFSAAAASGTIALTAGEIEITDQLTINGPGQHQLTIDAQQNSRLFNVTASSTTTEFRDLTLTGGLTAGPGGAVRSDALVRFFDSTVRGNETTGTGGKGGAISSLDRVALTRSTVSGNRTTGDNGDGGGIYAMGNVYLYTSTVSDNMTTGVDGDGAGILAQGEVTLTDSTISGNVTEGDDGDGGGIFAFDDVTIVQSTISGNRTENTNADAGGLLTFTALTIDNSTITDNHAEQSNAGGIRVVNGLKTITNSIVAGNTANPPMGSTHPDIDPGNGALYVNYSLIGVEDGLTISGGDNETGTAASPLDPLLGPLAFNGGLTQTHQISLFSSAQGQGSTGGGFDQRGAPFSRVDSGMDMGATELQGNIAGSLVVDTIVDENDGDYSQGDLSLREAIGLANGNFNFVADTITFSSLFTSPQTIELSRKMWLPLRGIRL